ncbi:MAG TPA: FkbM family methyltransferase, partial [Mycobacterium sp.]|nr:FkbM family methyltransferase [Mycobacterium sp.]
MYRPIAAGKLYEEGFLEYVRSLNLVGQYVDVGAHLGTHTVWFAKMCRSTHVHAFEPVSRYADVVVRNVVANGVDGKVTVHRQGLGAEAGRAENFLDRSMQVGFVDGVNDGVMEEFAVGPLD